jgi:beta-lactamase regulating signal transducer with metallopeptidase domain
MSGLWVPIAWNVALSTVLAVAVALANCLKAVRHRPALRHTLWALVLLKLITPPLIPLPVLPSHPVESSLISPHGLQELPASSALQPLVDGRQNGGVPPFDNAEALASPELANSTADSKVDATPEADRVPWPVQLAWLSVCGTLILVGWNVAQMFRVSGLLRRATPGGQRLERLVAQAGSWVGTKVVPGIRVVDARVTPLLWTRLRRPIIVLPRRLVDRLNDEQLSCIIRHEMAHHVRRDHWANVSGFAVAALFWWHPVVWWARREMQIAQELCCDALVLSGSDTTRRCYAETLFQTLEFVQSERPLVTMLGVGFGPRYSIRRRFEMIANATFKERGSWWTYAVVLSVVMVLPCLPVQGEPANDAEQFALQFPAKIAQMGIDSANLRQVIEVFGQPEEYVWGDKTFEPDALPKSYIMRYPGGFNIWLRDGQIMEVRHERNSKYVYREKLRVGSTLDEALAVLGPPKETVSGENNYKDRVLYKDIDGNKGHCYYLRTDQNVRLWFSEYKVIAIYLTRSDYGENEDEPEPDDQEFWRRLTQRLKTLDIDSATRERVIEIFGQPTDYVWGDETFEPDDLPKSYIMGYLDGFSIYISDGQIVEVRHGGRHSKYVYHDTLRVGSTLDVALAVLGPPD